MATWYFRPKQPGEPNREPIHGEFFASDAISDPGRALVREGIQNSLDAGCDDGPVLVRIFLSGTGKSITSARCGTYFDGAWSHLQAHGVGLIPATVPMPDSPCEFLVFEDFQTSGLEGDPAAAFKARDGARNNFYHFFRAEGQTDKNASHRGSWGVGKTVFLRASRISSVFGYTVRMSDNRALLMGKCVLKSHYVGDDYCQDGYFGTPPSEHQRLVLPVENSTDIDSFVDTFDLQRDRRSPGLSIVVPWPDLDINEHSLVGAVLTDYFQPILAGQLEVIVETPSVQISLDRNSIKNEVAKLDQAVSADLRALIDLAIWARDHAHDNLRTASAPSFDRAWQWSSNILSDDQATEMRKAFESGDRLAVRMPVHIRHLDGKYEESHFDIYLARDSDDDAGKPVFIREGIIISDVRAPRTRGVRAIVMISDGPLAGFLREAENPSHTDWNHVRLKGKFKHGHKTDLRYVSSSVNELVRALTAVASEEDHLLLSDLFPVPAKPEDEDARSSKTEKPGKSKGRGPLAGDPPQPRPKQFRIEKRDGGFSVLRGDNGAPVPEVMEVRVAYDVRRGSALGRYSVADFCLDKPPIVLQPEARNVDVQEIGGNRILARIVAEDFALHVVGFDPRRQLYIRVSTKEASHGDS